MAPPGTQASFKERQEIVKLLSEGASFVKARRKILENPVPLCIILGRDMPKNSLVEQGEKLKYHDEHPILNKYNYANPYIRNRAMQLKFAKEYISKEETI